MKQAILRTLEREYPELPSKLHLPRRAQVTRARETPKEGAIADDYRPQYAVTLQLLDEYGQPDTTIPELHDVPMSLPSAGHETGDFSYPENGTHVIVGFIDGSPNNPVITGILPHGRSLPGVKRGEKRRQHSAGNYDGYDESGNAFKHTAGTTTEDSLKRVVSALENLEKYTQSLRETEGNDTENVGGVKTVKALGGAKYHSAGRTEIVSGQDTQIKSKSNQRIVAEKTWLGTEGENVLNLLSLLMAEVKTLATVLASHTHPSVGPITQGADVSAVGSEVGKLKTRLDKVKS